MVSAGCNVIGDGDGNKVAGVCSGVASLDGSSMHQLHPSGRILRRGVVCVDFEIMFLCVWEGCSWVICCYLFVC